ncbi:MCE family protein [Nocardioides sp.]|uniref:MCE family protein n=1 Tax=Nocardioides sp. TaxID=35761 RepID=UPI0035173164
MTPRPPTTGRGAHRRPLLGLGYLALVLSLMATSIGIYRKDLPWQRRVEVTLRTSQVGLGLRPQADVEFQGVRVGEVDTVTTDGTVATVTLALDPDRVGQIPAAVDAMVVPKTLFGDKFVDLRAPAGALGGPPLRAGARIAQTATATELGEIFDKLVPLLRGLQPQRLASVLSSLADVLDGRGADIARTLRSTEQVLAALEPSYDDLGADLDLLAGVADTYATAAPDLVSILDDGAAIAREDLVPREEDLAALLDSVTGSSELTTAVLATNAADLVRLSGRSEPVLALLARYAEEVPCVLRALEAGNKLANLAAGVRGPYIALTIDMVTDNPGYTLEDLPSDPRSEAHVDRLPAVVPRWGPHCPVLPQRVTSLGPTPPPYSQQPYGQALRADPPPTSDPASPIAPATPSARAGGTASPRELLADALAAAALDVPIADLPPYAGLLVMPLTQGEVTLR